MAAAREDRPSSYPGSNVKDALRMIGILTAICSVIGGGYSVSQADYIFGPVAIGAGVIICALFFALAAIVENLIAIRQNTED